MKFLYALLGVVFLTGAGCLSMASAYIGFSVSESRWQKEKLNYEQRLGTESAKTIQMERDYKENFDVLAAGIKQTQAAVATLRDTFDKESLRRDRSNALAIEASREASQQAAIASRKAAALGQQLSAQQKVIVDKTNEAVTAAQATEKKIDTAVRPVAAVPAHLWGR